jgi:hypothetical protein
MKENNMTFLVSLLGRHYRLTNCEQSTIGNISGSTAWQTSGEQAKQHAMEAMKAASEGRDPAKDGFGKVEEMAGKVTGCEGMQKEGAESAKKH